MDLNSTRLIKRSPFSVRLVRLVACALLLASLGVQRGSAAEDPNYPGLPKLTDGGWVAPRATSVNYVGRAKQWVRVPPVIVGAWNNTVSPRVDNSCRRYDPFTAVTDYGATGFFRSPKGASEPWGIIGPFVTRTAAFGSIPVEASVQIRQPRDEENLPIGMAIKQTGGKYCFGKGPYPDRTEVIVPGVGDIGNTHMSAATAEGQVEVAVSTLKVDGVDLKLAGTCRTSRPGAIMLKGRELNAASADLQEPGVFPSPANMMTTPYFSLANGGLLTGTVDIPAFSGCVTTSGEDVSRLLTAAISGTDNPVSLRSEGLSGEECMVPDPPMGPGELCEPLPALPPFAPAN